MARALVPRLHPRERVVRLARTRLDEAVLDVVSDLTEGEALRVVGAALSDYVAGAAKHMIRAERHPSDPDKAGGLE